MFTAENLRVLLNATPFVPFRLVLSDGGTVEVRSREVVILGRHFAVIGLLDPSATDTLIDHWTTVWYMHVTRAEQLFAGQPPFTPPPGPAESPTWSPV
jgi:hypothetical protein